MRKLLILSLILFFLQSYLMAHPTMHKSAGTQLPSSVDKILPSNNDSAVIPVKSNDFSSFPFFSKKILAIGETIHGTQSMNDLGIEIIKGRIKSENCKLVLLEIPLTYSFYINRYLENDQRFELDSISSYLDYTMFSTPSFISLLQWIKEYNLHSTRKVHFFGLDSGASQLLSLVDFFEYFYTLNKDEDSEVLKNVCDSLLLYEEDFPLNKLLSALNTNCSFSDILNKQEMEMMKYCLKAEDRLSVGAARFSRRDSIMYENTSFLMNTFLEKDETVTVYSHLGHAYYTALMKWAKWDIHPFGEYMRSTFKDDYSCLGLMAGGGSYMTIIYFFKIGVGKLQDPPPVSLEHMMDQQNVNSCYLPIKKLATTDALKIRFIGNSERKTEQFAWIFPKSTLDGVIFIKEVSAIQRSEEVVKRGLNYRLKSMLSLMHAYERKRK